MIRKRNPVATAVILAALATPGAAVPALAAQQTPAWGACYALAVERGSGPNKGGGSRERSQHNGFMDQCMAGKIPLGVGPVASAARVPLRANAR